MSTVSKSTTTVPLLAVVPAPDRFHIPFVCKYSGLLLGKFYPNTGLYNKTTMDGMSPYVRNWQETVTLHPIFSVSVSALLIRARETFMLQKAGKLNFPMQQRQLMMLAMLHAGDAIVQDFPLLPEPRIADTYFAEVLEMIAWKHEVASTRLHFPRLHIGKDSGFEQVPIWLKVCASCREEYENVVRTRQKAAKVKASEMAIKSLRKNLFENISLRRLWNWMEVQIPAMEIDSWPEVKELFFVDEKNIHAWTQSEVDTLEEIFLEFCEVGNSISHEVSKRIEEIRRWLSLYEDTFEILVTDQFPEWKGVPAPKAVDFPAKKDFLVAEAKWRLANRVQTVVQPAAKPARKSSITKITDEDL